MKQILFSSVLILSVYSNFFSQLTTSEIRGVVRNEENERVVGVEVKLILESTGNSYNLISDEDGLFFLPQLKPGGPYKIVIDSSINRKAQVYDNIYLVLGETKYIEIELENKVKSLGDVEIISSRVQRDSKTGIETNIKADQIEKLPTLNRSLSDLTRTNTQTAGNSNLGTNYRYNNLSIDGASSNDAFGFQEPQSGAGGSTAAGTPGALSKTQPISLDAIDEVQLALSPYDVRLGNFTGGSLNVVTKSGTNKWQSSIYTFGRNQFSTGASPDEKREQIAKFFDIQSGFRVGGALKKDKLFMFINAENGYRDEPILNAAGSRDSEFKYADIKALKDTLMRRYSYDAGSIDEIRAVTKNNKFFIRFDWNINSKNQLVFRYNLVNGSHENISRSNNLLNFENQGFTHKSVTNNVVAELKTKINSKLFNSVILGFSQINDSRQTFGSPFPHIEIKYNAGNTIFLGSYREAILYKMNQKAFELTDNLIIYKKKHKITIGTHNELYVFNYNFVTPWNGRWAYNSIADFYANKPARIRGTYNLSDNSFENNSENPSAAFPVLLASVYMQDDYAVGKRFNLSYGLRLETNTFFKNQNTNETVRDYPQFAENTKGIKNQVIVSPRIGFNYDILGNGKLKVRGGIGIFAGKMPFAWAAYSYIYNGNQFGNVDYRPSSGTIVPLITSDFSQLANLQTTKKNEINLVDKNFKLPRVLRSSIGLESNLNKGFKISGDFSFTKNIYDALFQTLNNEDSLKPLSGNGADNRPVFTTSGGSTSLVNPGYTSVFLLTNTNKGYRYSLSLSIEKKFNFGLTTSIGYNYGVSRDVSNGVRVSPQANWEWNQTILANDPKLSYSNFDLRHRLISVVDYTIKFQKEQKFIVGGFFSLQSGSPFTYIYNGDLNRDGSPTNDLLFVPSSAAEINLVPIAASGGNPAISVAEQWSSLDSYISKDKYLSSKRGQYVERNGARTPINYQLDMRLAYSIDLKMKKKVNTLAISLDVFNVLNLLNYRWSQQVYVPNTTNAGYSLLTVDKVNAATGKADFKFNKPTGAPWQVDPLASRVQAQLGLRYSF